MVETKTLSTAERVDWLRLIRSENVGPVTFRQLIERFTTPTNALDALPELAKRGGGKRAIRICTKSDAVAEMEKLDRAGGQMIAICEPQYPAALANIPDAPPVLSVFGQVHLLEQRMIAIVGARNGSANGVRFTETLARELGQSDLMIASGLARGIDAAAHRGALNSGTVGVMAGGVDIIYPRENDSLYGQILESGALISEQPFGTRPQARHFPTRNRIVSGIALGTVVIEATLRSGSLITARLAGEQGRDIMAVPGTPMDPRARGTNKLIREGAVLVESADDVLEAMIPILRRPMTEHDPSPYHSPEPVAEISEIDMDEAREQIINALGQAPSTMDDIVRTSGVSSQFSAMVFLELELAGRLDRHPGGQVSLAFI